MNTLLISTCTEKLHEFEFVKPIEDILEKGNISFFVKHYSILSEKDLEIADKVVICGTSLQDNKFIKDIKLFEWLRDFGKPVLGICAGMQILGVLFGEKLKKRTEIGYYLESLDSEFLGLEINPDAGEHEVWHLHNSYVGFGDNWKIFMRSRDGVKIPEAVKHKERELYGVLFHPEVRQKEMVLEFVNGN